MKIYNSEHKAGLSEIITQNTSIALCSEVLSCVPTEKDISVATFHAIAENKNQIDLYYIDSILASTGWNKNDDVFDPVETWKARLSPEDKQFNYMHDEKDIIGHITSSRTVDHDGKLVAEIQSEVDVPNYFDIIVSSVLYTSWSDQDLKSRMRSIIEDIETEKTWCVSMECLFPNFDYAITEKNGSTKIVKREESSAFLSKHLRSYGGNGEYNGYKIGRLLRDFSFSGIGLVKKPANPRSIILNSNKPKIFSISKSEEIYMTDELETLKAELAEAKKANEEMKKKLEDTKAELDSTVASLLSQVAEAQEALASMKTEKEKMAEEMKNMKKEKMMMKRKADLVEAGIEEAEVEETLAKLENLEDSAFEVVVATMKTMKSKYAMKKEEKSATTANYQEEEVVDDSALDEAVASTEIPMVDSSDDDEEDHAALQAYASEYFGKFLKSTAKLNNN